MVGERQDTQSSKVGVESFQSDPISPYELPKRSSYADFNQALTKKLSEEQGYNFNRRLDFGESDQLKTHGHSEALATSIDQHQINHERP